jgi:enoyl-CoA hydratase/carnithine racemase
MDATNDVSAARPLGTSLVVPPPADERTHIALTRPHPDVWLASLYAPPDNKLTATAMKQLSAVLDTVEAEWRQGEGESPGRGGAFVLTSSNPKFFSNGLGLPANPDLYPRFLSVLWEGLKWRLLTFPLLTIAAINGHGAYSLHHSS